MTEILERVTKTIKKGIADDKPSDEIARDVLSAMRDPTTQMLEAGSGAGGFDAYRCEQNTPEIWREMIDAALGQ